MGVKSKRALYDISDEEDAAITAAALSDPDNPPLTAEEIANMRPLREVLPELAAAIDREIAKRGRPPVENPRQAVTLRLAPETLSRFKAKGRNWRAEMARILDEAG